MHGSPVSRPGWRRTSSEYGVTLLGGDTTSTPGPISLSLTIIGHVAPGQAVHRAGARPGDGIWVTGTIGDGALGLAVARGRLADPSGYLLSRYRLPQPRVGLAIAGIASAGMDVSDGLVQDLGHLCRAGSLAAEIDAALVPLSPPARAGRAGLARHLPDRWRRLRVAAGGPAGARCRPAAGGGRWRRGGDAHRRVPLRAGPVIGTRLRRSTDGASHRRLESLLIMGSAPLVH